MKSIYKKWFTIFLLNILIGVIFTYILDPLSYSQDQFFGIIKRLLIMPFFWSFGAFMAIVKLLDGFLFACTNGFIFAFKNGFIFAYPIVLIGLVLTRYYCAKHLRTQIALDFAISLCLNIWFLKACFVSL